MADLVVPSIGIVTTPGSGVVTVAEAKVELNIASSDATYDTELPWYVDASNVWIASKVADTTPAPVKLATLFLIKHWWNTQKEPQTAPTPDGDVVVIAGRGFAIPNAVKEMLGPYLSTSGSVPSYSFPDAVAWPDPVEWPT